MRAFAFLSMCCLASAGCTAHQTDNSQTNYLLDSQAQVQSMRDAITQEGLFADEFNKQQQRVDALLDVKIDVPIPADAGGGYTHEKHKENYALMRTAGRLYVITQDQKYADFVSRILLAYAEFYPTLPLHPKQKEQSPGKLFWQSLNEAMWLVYTSQAYDAVKDAISAADRKTIETNVFEPMVDYLSEQSPQTFDKIHNHGTWATAAVGMTGYVLGKPDWVEKALMGLDRSGKGGFMRQLDELFSPQGYYNEGPYYQRFALLPFVLFAQAIENNEPERKIFAHRDSVLLKAINTTVQLSYNGLFFAINDAIKDKGTDTMELVHGVAIAYNNTKEAGLLSIAQEQDQILLTGYGLEVAKALDAKQQQAYPYASTVFGDGMQGNEGALIVLRQNQAEDHQALVFKATSQGLGHGHFDKLQWMFYNKGEEVVLDYGAARFLNIEAKYGGHYLRENNTYAKQTIAHNTLVVDETSHFKGSVKEGNKHHPEVAYTEFDSNMQITSASISTAYDDVAFSRTQALVNTPTGKVFLLDVLNVDGNEQHQYDVPVHFKGQFIDTSVKLSSNATQQAPLGADNGYQHLWLQAQGKAEVDLAQVTWLLSNTFYTHSTKVTGDQQLLMTLVGATDPDFNLVANQAFINRVNATDHEFLSVLEVHGENNPTLEYVIDSASQLSTLENVSAQSSNGVILYKVGFKDNDNYLIAINPNTVDSAAESSFEYQGNTYQIAGQAELITLN